MKRVLVVSIVLVAALSLGCASATDSRKKKGAMLGAAIGTAVGAGVGYAAGGGKGAAIGAASGLVVGGLTGAAVGKYMDDQEAELRQAFADAENASIQRDQDVLAVTFKADVMFDVDSADLKAGAYDEIDRVASVLVKYPKTRIRIEGHTDSTGSEEYNMGLSERRAESVKKAFIVRNINAARLDIIGLGESKPVAGNDTPEGRQMNRRVRIVIVPITA